MTICNHSWKQEYYGSRCADCGLFYPDENAPWNYIDEDAIAHEEEAFSRSDDLDEWVLCPHCESDMDWVHCDSCGGEGDHDAYELDPMWYDPGDTTPCPQCAGVGGWYWCSNSRCAEKTSEP